MKSPRTLLVLLVAVALFIGCGEKDADGKSGDSDTSASIDASQFLLTSEPENARPVLAVRESAKDDEDIVIVGRIGGSTHPWVKDAAAFTIVDAALPACGDEEECNCPTPWDYCCETSETIVSHSAMVKFMDADQRTSRFDPKKVFGIEELQTVIVQGKAKRDDAGNLTVLAEKIFIKK